jgi:O-antigen/teichoic acid export membrane protein
MRTGRAAGHGDGSALSQTRSQAFWSVGWSGAFLLVSRLAAVLAVPLVLHSLGSALYGVWVMGGALIMIQGLFDLGVGAALVRFVAVGAARGSRTAVLIVFRRALVFYLALSVAIGVPLLIWAGGIASLLPSVHASAESQAALLIRYAAVAFALTNVTLVLASLLQGVDRVDAAYRGQTLGWLLYVPVLALGILFDGAAHAVGLAWVCSYALQVVFLSASAQSAVGDLSESEVPPPSFRQMLSLGGWWQLSSWADFATFQLPRLAGAFVFSASSLVALDVALRAAQLVVAPLFAVYPLVLPAAAKAWTLRGREGLRIFLERWFLRGAIALWLLATTFVPVEQPVLAAWTGRPAHSFNVWLNASVLIGIAAHASTGLFSSALLAAGDISPVLRYKKRQLILGLVLVPISLIGGAVTTGIALAIALAAPAFAFNRQEAHVFSLHLPSRRSPVLRRVAAATAVILAALSAAAWLLEGVLPMWLIASTLLPLWGGACVLAWLWCWSSWAGDEAAQTPHPTPDAERLAL